ncbi:unnamed protein product [Blepharisma stoltei]|uniref:Uncharacterized protein n=1 Tax=Blepharisma stoltei TaxID=1481888 RepID=A0AAU9JAW2_9CILI|nr:unnamed protein product [Blepharisma stoltei]
MFYCSLSQSLAFGRFRLRLNLNFCWAWEKDKIGYIDFWIFYALSCAISLKNANTRKMNWYLGTYHIIYPINMQFPRIIYMQLSFFNSNIHDDSEQGVPDGRYFLLISFKKRYIEFSSWNSIESGNIFSGYLKQEGVLNCKK